jgi:hypothetical protein
VLVVVAVVKKWTIEIIHLALFELYNITMETDLGILVHLNLKWK